MPASVGMASQVTLRMGKHAAREALPDALPDVLQEAHRHLGAGRLEQAERGYRQILRVDGRQAEALHGLGLVALRANNCLEAARLMRAAIALDLRADVYRTNLGNVLQMQGLLGEAVEEYERALVLRPDSVAALSNLGTALLGLGGAAEAVERLRRAAKLQPDSGQIWDNLGNALQALGGSDALEEAVSCHERALARMPEHADAHGNLGLALAGLGRWEAAGKSFEVGLTHDPGNARIQLARAQLQMLREDFLEGWANYEWRKRVHGERQQKGREWRGEEIAPGERLLVYAEQGLGDTVQFLRYLSLVEARIGRDAELILEVQEPMRRLAEEISSRAVGFGETPPDVDWHCSLMSLPLALEAGVMPAPATYLQVPEEPRRRIDDAWEGDWSRGSELQVGLVWAGNRKHVRDRFRSIRLAELEPLLRLEGVRFHSLQLGEPAEGLVDWSGNMGDMADTAAILERLDLAIGVDTAVVHLAGALGRRVWTMLPFWPDWRWGLEREDCLWYPTMRLFRQTEPGDWAGVMQRVRAALIAEAGR